MDKPVSGRNIVLACGHPKDLPRCTETRRRHGARSAGLTWRSSSSARVTYGPLSGKAAAWAPVQITSAVPAMRWPADEWRAILDQIPAPIERMLFLKCPRCGHRTWNCHGAESVGYQGHYMGHLIDDLQAENGP